MAASELSVQPQLAQARAVRGIAAVSGINKQHKTSGVAAPRRAIAEIFIASPENAKDTGAHRARNEPAPGAFNPGRVCSWRWIDSGETRRAARRLLACWAEAGVSLRNLGGRGVQGCDFDGS